MIDFHLHIGHFGRSVEQTLAHMDASGARQTVILPIDGTSIAREHWPTEVALDAARAHPDRLIPFCHADPRKPDALDRVRRYHTAGARGYGEHKIGLPCDAPGSMAVYRRCGELGMPVLLHFQYGAYNANIQDFETVLRALPRHDVHRTRAGLVANMSADVPTAAGFSHVPKGPVVRGGLRNGRRLGFVANSDNHRCCPGMAGALTGVYASELTRAAILDALRSHRCFATDGSRIAVQLWVNDTFMGGKTAVDQVPELRWEVRCTAPPANTSTT